MATLRPIGPRALVRILPRPDKVGSFFLPEVAPGNIRPGETNQSRFINRFGEIVALPPMEHLELYHGGQPVWAQKGNAAEQREALSHLLGLSVGDRVLLTNKGGTPIQGTDLELVQLYFILAVCFVNEVTVSDGGGVCGTGETSYTHRLWSGLSSVTP